MFNGRQPELSTRRLLLRPLEQGDAPAIRAMAGTLEVAENTFLPHPYKEEKAKEFIASRKKAWEEGAEVSFAITVTESGTFAGVIGLKDIEAGYRRAEMGYWLGVAYWGKGYATEAACETLRFAFGRLELNRVFAACFHTNPASCRVLEKAGMKQEGVLRQHVYRFGAYRDLIMYGVLREEWSRP